MDLMTRYLLLGVYYMESCGPVCGQMFYKVESFV